MRKLFFVGCLSVVLALVMISCSTTSPDVSASTMNIPNPAVDMSLSPSDYTVLGRVTGNGRVSYNANTGVYTGDTLKYGSLGALSSIGSVGTSVSSSGFWGLGTSTQAVVQTPSSSRDMAIGNATYDLIEKAKALGADAVIFVTTSVESEAEARTRISTSIVTISGIAVKLK